jgi:hypothetical protein
MLSGHVPFSSETPAGFLRKHLNDAPPPFHTLAGGLSVPREVEAVVSKALAKNRDERYLTALLFAREFAQAASASAQAESAALGATEKINTLEIQSAELERQAHEKAEAERRERENVAAAQTAWDKSEQERLAHEHADAERRERENAAAAQAARAKAEQDGLARMKAEAERREKEKVVSQQAAQEKARKPVATEPDPNAIPAETAAQLASPWRQKRGAAVKVFSIVSAGILAQIVIGLAGAAFGLYLHTPDPPQNSSEGWMFVCTLGPVAVWLVYAGLIIRYGMKSRSMNEPAISDDLRRGVRMGTTLAIVLVIVWALSYMWALSGGNGLGWGLFWTSGPLGVALAAFLFSRRWASKARRLGELAPVMA